MFTLAHYWGIDEVGVFVVPAVLAILALRWAERRAKRAVDRTEKEDSEDPIDVE